MSGAAVLSGTSYVGPSEAARRLGVSKERVRQLIAEGRLSAVLTPLGRIVPVSAVEAEARRRASLGGESERGGAHG